MTFPKDAHVEFRTRPEGMWAQLSGHSSGPESSQCEADLGFSPVLQGRVPGEAWVISDD